MKKDANQLKLRLNRETLRSLAQSDLAAALGGATTLASVDLTSCNTCNTRNTCTSRYC